jgi:hypothetical protein
MNPEQLRLGFEADLSHEAHWILRKKGCDDAASILIDLLNKGLQDDIPFHFIAAIKCGLQPNEPIPPEKHLIFTDNVAKVHDERRRIKDEVEEISGYRLVIVGMEGQSARMNGRGSAYGFALRISDAGIQDDKAQIGMSVGSIKSALSRHPELRDHAQALLTIPALIGTGSSRSCYDQTEEDPGRTQER